VLLVFLFQFNFSESDGMNCLYDDEVIFAILLNP